MAILEILTIDLGASLAKALVKLWFKDPLAEAAASGLLDTLKKRVGDFDARWRTEQLFKNLQSEIARRLVTVIDAEFPGLAENEREAAILATADVFNRIELSAVLFEADLDATRLETALRPSARSIFQTLGGRAHDLANLLLRECCNYVVRLADKLPSFQAAALTEVLKRDTELMTTLMAVLDQLSAQRLEASTQGNRENENFELQYRRALSRQLDRMELFGLRLIGGGAREYGLTVAYVTLSAQQGNPPTTGRVDSVLADQKHVLIRGEAGSGKTTLLQWLAVRAANRDLPASLEAFRNRVPLYIRLRDYAKASIDLPSPESYLDKTTPNLLGEMPKGWVHSALRAGALLLVDGIDELPANRRLALFSWLRGLVGDFPETRVIASSRPAAVDAEPADLARRLRELGFEALTLEPMTLRDSDALVAQWHAAVARDRPDDTPLLLQYERDLRSALRERPTIRNLATSPLLCAMICALNWDRRKSLPDDRMVLYQLALDLLLDHRDAERGVGTAMLTAMEKTEKEELLDAIAYYMLLNGRAELDWEDARDEVRRQLPRLGRLSEERADSVLQELLERSGVLRQPQHGTVDFIHRTFLEYMGARAVVRGGNFGFLEQKAREESWRETVVFAAGHARGVDRSRLVRGLLKDPFFGSRPLEAKVTAACCLETVSHSLEPDLLAQLRRDAGDLFPPRDLATASLLAPAALHNPSLLEKHQGAAELQIAACIRAASVLGGPRMLEVISSYATVPGALIDEELLRAWDAYEDDLFAKEVLRRRERLLDLDMTWLSDEQLACLRFLVGLGNHGDRIYVRSQLESLGIGSLTVGPRIWQAESGFWPVVRSAFQSTAPTHRALRLRAVDGQRLARLSALNALTLFSASIEPGFLECLSALSALRELELWADERVDLEPLGELRLDSLTLFMGPIDPQPLRNCTTLNTLRLRTRDDEALDWIAPLVNLRELRLFGSASGPAIARYAPQLRKLAIAGSTVGSGEWLTGLRGLEELDVSNVKGPLNGIEAVPGLRRVSVSQCDLLDCSHLARCPVLEELSLHSVKNFVYLDLLAAVSRLRELNFYRCSVKPEDEAIEAFRRRGVKITFV